MILFLQLCFCREPLESEGLLVVITSQWDANAIELFTNTITEGLSIYIAARTLLLTMMISLAKNCPFFLPSPFWRGITFGFTLATQFISIWNEFIEFVPFCIGKRTTNDILQIDNNSPHTQYIQSVCETPSSRKRRDYVMKKDSFWFVYWLCVVMISKK